MPLRVKVQQQINEDTDPPDFLVLPHNVDRQIYFSTALKILSGTCLWTGFRRGRETDSLPLDCRLEIRWPLRLPLPSCLFDALRVISTSLGITLVDAYRKPYRGNEEAIVVEYPVAQVPFRNDN